MRCTSGTAASASGAACRSGCAPAWVCRRRGIVVSTLRRRARAGSCWPRRSAGWGTGSTRSCTAGPRPCRGASRSTRRTGRPSPPRRDLPPDVPVRAAVEPRRRRAVLWADRRCRLGGGRVFALYVALYCVGRAWIEALRVDTPTPFRHPAQRLRHGRRLRRRGAFLVRRRGGSAWAAYQPAAEEPATPPPRREPRPDLTADDPPRSTTPIVTSRAAAAPGGVRRHRRAGLQLGPRRRGGRRRVSAGHRHRRSGRARGRGLLHGHG